MLKIAGSSGQHHFIKMVEISFPGSSLFPERGDSGKEVAEGAYMYGLFPPCSELSLLRATQRRGPEPRGCSMH